MVVYNKVMRALEGEIGSDDSDPTCYFQRNVVLLIEKKIRLRLDC